MTSAKSTAAPSLSTSPSLIPSPTHLPPHISIRSSIGTQKNTKTSIPHSTSSSRPFQPRSSALLSTPPTTAHSGHNGFTGAFGNSTGTTPCTQSMNNSLNSSWSISIVLVYVLGSGRIAEGVKVPRPTFWRARKDWWAPWGVYETSSVYLLLFLVCNIPLTFFFSSSLLALMRYRCSDVASRISEMGLQLFGHDVESVLRCLGLSSPSTTTTVRFSSPPPLLVGSSPKAFWL